MLSKARIKFIKSLQLKKYRKQEQCFVVEGGKSVQEVLQSDFNVMTLVATQEFIDTNRALVSRFRGEVIVASADQLKTLGDFSTNDSALAVVRMKEAKTPDVKPDSFCLVLDDIRDPGNLGTIIRIADWYGIKNIIASPGTADGYNSKVIASSMGSFTRVNIYYTGLVDYLKQVNVPVIGAFLTGENIHQVNDIRGGLLVIGNEANGISKEVETLVSRRVTIPRMGKAESLNAAVATAIVCDNLIRHR
ncbi:RNA methyltransferase [Oscillatoria amoena NRMC-F 0135]|nr:RNA methyltransferase [Oscillatoria amoena NRMC-F 0135]